MMNRKCFARRGVNRLRQVPREESRNADAGNACLRKCWQMQGLADMARRVAPAVLMFMEKRAAGCKVKQRYSGQQGQCATCVNFGENSVHESQSTFRIHCTVPV